MAWEEVSLQILKVNKSLSSVIYIFFSREIFRAMICFEYEPRAYQERNNKGRKAVLLNFIIILGRARTPSRNSTF